MQDSKLKYNVQKVIVTISILLLIGKVVAYQLTNSVGILTDALESIVNVLAGVLSLISIGVALKPKDANHPFGHGKVELLSASVEGLLIAVAGAIIIYEAIYRFFVPSEIQKLDIGILIIAIAGLINYIMGVYSIKIGKKHNSIALISGGKHLKSDTYSTIGLVLGLFILYLTDYHWLDSTIAILFGLIIAITGIKILKQTTSNLMDEADFEIMAEIVEIMNQNRTEERINISNSRIIKYGDTNHIDCDLTIPWYFNINDAERISKTIKSELSEHFKENIDLALHVFPCKAKDCPSCLKSDCRERQAEFTGKSEWTLESIIKLK